MRYSDRVKRVMGDGAAAWDLHMKALEDAVTDPDVIVLSVGDPNFSTPEVIVNQAIKALHEGDTHYTQMCGRPGLRTAIAREVMALGGPDIAAANVAVLAGAQNALFTTSLCLLSPGDEVITLDPMYVTYEAYLGVSGANLVRIPCAAETGFRPDAAAIEAAITPHTRAIAYSNPNNPSGIVMSRAELEAIADIAKRHDLWVISDEVYGRLTFEEDHTVMAGLPGMAERTVTIGSLSKSHAMTGWRIGWMVGPEELICHAENMILCMLYGLPGFLQEAATSALTDCMAEAKAMRNAYRQRRDLVVEALGKCDKVKVLSPQSGMFVLVDIRDTGMSAFDFSRALYAAEKVSVLDGAAFGENVAGFVRLSFTSSDERLQEGCARLIRFVKGLG